MKTISVALLASLASGSTKLATCLKMTLTNGDILGATTHDADIVFDGVTYLAASGGTMSDVESSAALAVQNGEMKGLLNLDSITEADMRAGLYDYATISVFVVNWSDLTQGKYSQVDGKIGQVTTDRLTFTAELRGLTQALSRTIGRLCSAMCSARLGDSRCRVDLDGDTLDPATAITVTGTLDFVGPDNATFTDTARTEPGPEGAIAITAISNADPCVITTASPIETANGGAVVLYGINGPELLNGIVTVRNKSGSTFEIDVDTSDTGVYPPYTTGGNVVPIGGLSGYFDYGVFTVTSGPCAGRSMEVKAYVPGQWTTQLPMPYQVSSGDTYTMVAGCNKIISTCNEKFGNHLNFQGRPYVPGQDKVVQVGRRS